MLKLRLLFQNTVHRVVRRGGSIGSVSLLWAVSSSGGLTSSRDISPSSRIITFGHGVQAVNITLIIEDDDIPELAEMFEVELTILGGVSNRGARLGNASLASIVIRESDEPNGVLRVADASTTLAIAEDVPLTDMSLGQAQVLVDRTFGTIGSVRALWEVLPVSSNILPNYIDMIFIGIHGPGVGVATPRPNTATSALRFSGQPGSVVSVPSQYQPRNISSGFTIRYSI